MPEELSTANTESLKSLIGGLKDHLKRLPQQQSDRKECWQLGVTFYAVYAFWVLVCTCCYWCEICHIVCCRQNRREDKLYREALLHHLVLSVGVMYELLGKGVFFRGNLDCVCFFLYPDFSTWLWRLKNQSMKWCCQLAECGLFDPRKASLVPQKYSLMGR